MAHNPHAHLQREIDSLRKQLIQERDQRRFDDSLLVTTTIKQAEERTLERCIVECMEEANAPMYTEEERVAILTATERLKEMRAERIKEREDMEARQLKQEREVQRQFVMSQMMQEKTKAFDMALNEAVLYGKSLPHMVMDENADIRWSNISNPKEWLK